MEIGEPDANDETQCEMEAKAKVPSQDSVKSNTATPSGIFKGLKSLKNPYSRNKSRPGASPPSLPEDTGKPCGVCFDPLLGSIDGGPPVMRCGHKFCRSCWEAYLTSKIRDEGQCIVRCMATKCRTTLYQDFMEDISPTDVYAR